VRTSGDHIASSFSKSNMALEGHSLSGTNKSFGISKPVLMPSLERLRPFRRKIPRKRMSPLRVVYSRSSVNGCYRIKLFGGKNPENCGSRKGIKIRDSSIRQRLFVEGRIQLI
jgi:hypothetical protein